MSGSIATGLEQGALLLGTERADDEKTTLHQAERWATLLGAQLAAIPTPQIASEPTTGWRAGAGDMTPVNPSNMTGQGSAASAIGSSDQSGDQSENRMTVRVDGGDLGEVALIVDRKEGAIRVTISAQDAVAEAALNSERSLLMQALQSHGITVDSVNVVRAGNIGTLPAPRSLATRRTRETAEAESQDGERERRRLARKLNLIG